MKTAGSAVPSIDYDAVLAAQGNVCAICGRKPTGRRLDRDHDHRSGAFRGLICNGCNRVMATVDHFGTARVASALLYAHNPPGLMDGGHVGK